MKDETNQQETRGGGQGEDISPQALGRFLLDDQGDWIHEPEVTSTAQSHAVLNEKPTTGYDQAIRSESVQQRIIKVLAAENPLLEAAQPLLRALSDMPEHISNLAYVESLKNTLKSQIKLFGIVCDEVNIPWKKMAIVRYCLCTALDEAALTVPWGLQAGWSQSNLLNHFEGDNDGGNKFFLLIGRLSINPTEFADVLEVLLRILGLGFEGRYSVIEDGDRKLTRIRQRLLTLVQSTRNTTQPILSPHGLQPYGTVRREKFIVPVRITALCAGILITSVFISCQYLLQVKTEKIINGINAMKNVDAIRPQVKMRLRLSSLLRNEIQRQLLSVEETLKLSKVVLKGDSLFLSGSTKVQPEMINVIERVAREVRRVNGDLLIVGHTDARPISRPGLPNNVVLSEKRAYEVARYFIEAGIPESKVKVEGVGGSQPIASDATAQGRAKNRRVEFFVTY